ncbi:DNA primase [Microbacterium sediminis]|uniref:DNA primase n=1 Tax=Microbacterium sediminis TaxID=904291 RepID=A0A1B9N8G4_9MICO|nr:DNA primase [Microbacterium sediminis]
MPDARLLEAHDLALEALREITPASSIGAPAGHRVEPDGVVSLLFENTMRGYPGWYWTVSLAVVEDAEPTVLEAELLPGEGALLAPEWVPWAVRLKEYQAAQAAAAEAEANRGDDETADDLDADEDDDDLDEDDLDDELDDEDFDADATPILHSGDVDGVDIDELDESDEDDSDDDESNDEDSDDDDSDDESDDDESDDEDE